VQLGQRRDVGLHRIAEDVRVQRLASVTKLARILLARRPRSRVDPTLQIVDARFQSIPERERRRRVFIHAHEIDLAAQLAELIRESKRPPIEATVDAKRHRHSVGPGVFALEMHGAGGGIELSASNRRVLPSGVYNAANLIRLDDDVERDFRWLPHRQ
jgi:hypothetical protein